MELNRMVSVIMPAYNAEAFIADSIQSVIAQTYPNWELLVIDDASTDNMKEIVKGFSEKDKRIKLLENDSNLGTHHSRNRGIKAAQGHLIAFLDADDQWKPSKLYTQVKILQKGNVAACFSSYELISENGEPLNKKIEALPILSYEKLLKANYVGNLTGIYDAQKIGKIYCPEISKRQDWALWLKVIEKGGPMKGIEESLAIYRVRKNSISRNKLEMLKYNFKVYHEVLGYSYFSSLSKMFVFLNEQFFVKSRQTKTMITEK
ncbi:glycosyltransferase family 2 protein [Gramella sp. MT6]|uniref:glycosyltransferase family 2 protein n=1 Tax=Gramella sp. MT6 TaxID=2705471 RepID=UPI001C5EABF6|nr:glycosyltransferase family 2 protein [Gramella sp. MT6]QYA24897.1 glycosyltransferase family 2 protein [Gramella sp. MT6]